MGHASRKTKRIFQQCFQLHTFVFILCIFCCTMICLTYVTIYYHHPTLIPSEKNVLLNPTIQVIPQTETFEKGFLIDTSGCHLRSLSPYDPSIASFFHRSPPQDCNDFPILTSSKGAHIIINRKVYHHFKYRIRQCYATPFIRGNNDSVIHWLQSTALTLRSPFIMSTDFTRVYCNDKKGKLLYENFHFKIDMKPPVNGSVPIESYNNVLLLGVDSTSRLNLLRQMPKTVTYLRSLPNHYEMLGYNKLGENTFPNLVPLLSGKLLQQQPCFNAKEFFDSCPLIWKDFEQMGYTTLYAEDRPHIGTFQFNKPGFQHRPTQFYLRPLMLAVDEVQTSKVRLMTKKCIGYQTETAFVLDYTRNFIQKQSASKRPFFALAFISGSSHDDINGLATVDKQYESFFRYLHKSNILSKTLVIFFSDHGLRITKFRETSYGRLEARLPFLHILVPSTFADHQFQLERNARLLTTPLDLHATLKHFLLTTTNSTANNSSSTKGTSLFTNLPSNRSCTDAGVSPMWCTCRISNRTLPETSQMAKIVAEYLVSYINEFLNREAEGLCQTLVLDKILNVIILENETLLNIPQYNNQDFLITISVEPSKAIFEAAVGVFSAGETNQLVTHGLTRTNSYGQQSHCVNQGRLKNYCFCYETENTV